MTWLSGEGESPNTKPVTRGGDDKATSRWRNTTPQKKQESRSRHPYGVLVGQAQGSSPWTSSSLFSLPSFFWGGLLSFLSLCLSWRQVDQARLTVPRVKGWPNPSPTFTRPGPAGSANASEPPGCVYCPSTWDRGQAARLAAVRSYLVDTSGKDSPGGVEGSRLLLSPGQGPAGRTRAITGVGKPQAWSVPTSPRTGAHGGEPDMCVRTHMRRVGLDPGCVRPRVGWAGTGEESGRNGWTGLVAR